MYIIRPVNVYLHYSLSQPRSKSEAEESPKLHCTADAVVLVIVQRRIRIVTEWLRFDAHSGHLQGSIGHVV